MKTFEIILKNKSSFNVYDITKNVVLYIKANTEQDAINIYNTYETYRDCRYWFQFVGVNLFN